ncbi:glycosyltransferase family 2 protein [Pseudactinotalea terrae]|uniref:glycosyltransferase family 2 protein n=1 Tax=Pseudactinotalea terrae TaxID=1743262 RepID=UPI0012E2F121|nr:glycosyltransferase family 2 protein [Pseudactinotalea terrae]
MIGVVVPAHNEENGLPRLLAALQAPVDSEALEVVVVANGCTDGTAAIARSHDVHVIETPVPSKIQALALGDRSISGFPRLYVDGDVVITYDDVVRLAGALGAEVHAAGPRRSFPMTGVATLVRLYYRIWQQLPGVRDELYGRGVICVDEVGHERLRGWRDVMSDDLLIAMSFAPQERVVVEGTAAVIRPPKTYRDLLRRRVRAATGNARLASSSDRPQLRGSGASLGFLIRLAGRSPRLLPGVLVFAITGVLARVGAAAAVRRGDTRWHRDESSRS